MRNLDFAHSNASHGGTFSEETCQFIFISLALSLISPSSNFTNFYSFARSFLKCYFHCCEYQFASFFFSCILNWSTEIISPEFIIYDRVAIVSFFFIEQNS